MTILDGIIVGLFLLVVIGLGLKYRHSKTLDDYLLASGKMPWWAVGISLIATSVSTTSFVGSPAEAYAHDLRYLTLHFGVPLSLLLVTLVFIPFFRRLSVRSAYEALEIRFDLKVRLLCAGMYIAHVLLRTGILILGPSLVISRILGIPLNLTIAGVGFLAIAYAAVGGLKAVIWTDVLQFAALVGSALLACVVVWRMVPGGFSAIMEAASQAGKTRVVDLSFSVEDPRTLWAAGVAYVVLDLAIRATDQQFVQRYLSCGSVAKAQGSALLAASLGLLVSVLFFLLGLHLWAYYQIHPSQAASFTSADQALPSFMAEHLGGGPAGLMLVGLLAAAMSSIDSAIAALSHTASVDFRERLLRGRPPAQFGKVERQEDRNRSNGDQRLDDHHRIGDDAESLGFARLGMVVFGILGIASAYLASSAHETLLHTALSVTSLFTGSLLGIFLLAVLPWRLRPNSVFAGALLGGATLLASVNLPEVPLAWPYRPVISCLATMAFSLTLNWLLGAMMGRRSGITSTHSADNQPSHYR